MAIHQQVFGNFKGKEVPLFTLENENGMRFMCTPFGGIITGIYLPTPHSSVNLVLGFDRLEDYQNESYRKEYPYLGAVIGRNAGRIAGSCINIEGVSYALSDNRDGVQLHGGFVGFDSVLWTVEQVIDGKEPYIELGHFSPDGDEGFPGNVNVLVRYTLTSNNELSIQMQAVTDKDTVINLTQHAYFNFNTEESTLKNHNLQLNTDQFLPVDEIVLPLGNIVPTAGSRFDYTHSRPVEQGIDHSYLVNQSHCATLTNTDNQIEMEVWTDRPVLHIYTGDSLSDYDHKKKRPIQPFGGICFETQGYPDALNHPAFIPTIVRAGETFYLNTTFKFKS